jgi:hypothetical protein
MTFSRSVGSVALVIALALAGSAPATAFDPVNTDSNNVAIEGYDTVAYFTEGEPVRGDPAYEHEWQGARWQFSSAGHRDLFAGAPDRYAPRYGGFCSGAMADGRKFRADPEAWKIIDGKLYLNFTASGIETFAEGADEAIPKADANWDRLEPVNRPD